MPGWIPPDKPHQPDEKAPSQKQQDEGLRAKQRREEAWDLLDALMPELDQMNDADMEFVQDMQTKREHYGVYFLVSQPQLDWLNDIQDKLR